MSTPVMPERSGQSGTSEALLAAEAEFNPLLAELNALEEEVRSHWGELQEDLPLVHAVSKKEVAAIAPRIAERTAAMMDRRIRAAKIEPRLRLPSPLLPPGGLQAGRKLRAATKVESRLVELDRQMQVYERAYATINQHLSESRLTRGGIVAVIAILCLLTIGTILIIADFVMSHT
jgi:hypothetical protein